MNIKLDKALLWLLPYLYFVATVYHWGYWGTFGIDAFNFYPAAELIKGAAAFTGDSLLFTFLICILVCGIMYTNDKFEYAYILWIVPIILVIPLVVWLNQYLPSTKPAATSTSSESFRWLRIILTLLSTFIAIAISELPNGRNLFVNKKLRKKGPFKYAKQNENGPLMNSVRFTGVLFICLIPSQVYVDALVKASYIEQNKAYDYVVAEHANEVLPRGIYKYLGKAGEYYVLLTKDNFKQIMLPSDKLVPLYVEHYDSLDKESKARFTFHTEQLKIVVPLQSK